LWCRYAQSKILGQNKKNKKWATRIFPGPWPPKGRIILFIWTFFTVLDTIIKILRNHFHILILYGYFFISNSILLERAKGTTKVHKKYIRENSLREKNNNKNPKILEN